MTGWPRQAPAALSSTPPAKTAWTCKAIPRRSSGIFPEVLADFCGVGDPFSLEPLNPGDAVLDIGCGAGVDSLVAAHLVGAGGKVVGLDVTAAMVERARANLARLGLAHVTFQVGEAEALPFPDDEFRRGHQ